MTRRPSRLPTPRRAEVDLAQLAGLKVLGEPVTLLFGGLLRLQFGPPRDGMMKMSSTWPRNEADALERAMERVERRIPGDPRDKGQRDYDRFMAVMERVFEAIQLARDCRAREAFVRAPSRPTVP
jgi:hypothetical protein